MFDMQQELTCGYFSRRKSVSVLGSVLLLVFMACASTCFSPADAIAQGTPAADAAAEKSEPLADKARSTNRQKAYVLLVALAGIVIAGLGLATMTLLWAGRLRRQLRRPMPECEVPDRDFWFLKPPKPTVERSSLSDSHLPPHDPAAGN